MATDETLAINALSLADGADIHNIAGMVAMYRCLAREGCDASRIERELRCYVARKRLDRVSSDCFSFR